jgi:hypothetical protein
VQRTLIVIGIAVLVAGLLWPWISQLPFGRLPGDLVIERPNLKLYFPITSTILASIVLSVLLWIFRQ